MFDAAVRTPRPAQLTPRSTPGRIVQAAGLVVVLAVVAAIVALGAARQIQDAAQTIGQDAEPSVVLALRMAATLSDMDAAVLADALTDNGAAAGTSAQYGEDLRALTGALVLAAGNVTYGEAEAAPLRNLQELLVRYEQAVVEARYIGAGDPWVTSRRLQWASRVNRDMAIPEAQGLARANADELEQRYAHYRATSVVYGGAGCLAFAALVMALLAVQVWLARRVRRLVNPLLATATLVAGLGGAWFGAAVFTERTDLRVAKSDAYDSLHVLYQAKVQANAMRAAGSLWLLDPSVRPGAQAAIDDAGQALVHADLTRPDQRRPLQAALQSALRLEQQGRAAEAAAAAGHAGGLLGAELDNVTFGLPERAAATASVARLADAEALVRTVQTADRPSAHVLTVARWLGEGARTFAALQGAVDATIAVNQDAFDRRVTSALRGARLIPFVASAALTLTAALAVGGLWLRLREYR